MSIIQKIEGISRWVEQEHTQILAGQIWKWNKSGQKQPEEQLAKYAKVNKRWGCLFWGVLFWGGGAGHNIKSYKAARESLGPLDDQGVKAAAGMIGTVVEKLN